MTKSKISKAILLAFSSLTVTTPVWSQVNDVPTPGTLLEGLRPAPMPLPTLGEGVSISLPALLPGATPDPDAPRFVVKAFVFKGNVAMSSEALRALAADYEGKSLNPFDLQKLTAAITQHYRNNGYPVANTVVPAQKVDSGVVQIEVIEGKFDRVLFNGNMLYNDQMLQKWAAPLIDQTVELAKVEERLLTFNDLPGLQVRGILVPGAEYGTTTMQTEVAEEKITGQATLNNYGRQEVGQHRVETTVNLNNLTETGDQFTVRGSVSEGGLMQMGGLSYTMPVGIGGDRLGVSYTYVDYALGGKMSRLNIRGRSELASVNYIHPIIRSAKQNLFSTFAYRSFSSVQSPASMLPPRDYSVPEIGLSGNKMYDNGDTLTGGLRMSSNFQSSEHATVKGAQAFKIDGELMRSFQLDPKWILQLSGAMQWATDSLPDAEKFSVGGPQNLRGYAPADIRGDSGAMASAELKYRLPSVEMPIYASVFADGAIINRAYTDTTRKELKEESVGSYGIGLTFQPAKNTTGRFVAALPTEMRTKEDKHGRLWLSLTAAF